jgi:hypothetical protein
MMSGPEGTVPRDLQRFERCLLLRIRRGNDIRKRCAGRYGQRRLRL